MTLIDSEDINDLDGKWMVVEGGVSCQFNEGRVHESYYHKHFDELIDDIMDGVYVPQEDA